MTEIDKVELASVRVALAAAVAEKGADHIYEKPQMLWYDDDLDEFVKGEPVGCVYLAPVFDKDDTVKDYAPSCIWGHALLTMGVTVDELLPHNEDEGIGSAGMPVPWTDRGISKAAEEAQRVQDMGGTWGAAVAAFDETIEKVERGLL